jgi:Transglycosylase SLT domain
VLKTGIIALAALFSTAVPALAGSEAARTIDVHAMFSAVGAMYGLDSSLLEAIATVESHGHSDAVSSAGAMGLMQLMPATAVRFGVDDPFDPVESALGAARFLSHLQSDPHMERQLPDLLAAYNAGEGAVERFGGVPPYRETKQYVRRVLLLYLLGTGPLADVRSNKSVTEDLAKDRKAAHHALHDGDRAVLGQLAELRRMRDAAVAKAAGAR